MWCIVRELTKREREILIHIADGFSNAEIAERLFVPKGTIQTHRRNIMQKFGTKKVARLIILALYYRMIEIDEEGNVRLYTPKRTI